MALYALLTKLSPNALSGPQSIEDLDKQVAERVKQECPEVKWQANYAVLGPYDYLDIFEAPDSDTASKVALIVRSLGHGTTETWTLTGWDRYRQLAGELRKAS